MKPLPHQIEGAEFLATRKFAVLADEPRVGKTGAAIMAADAIGAGRILVVTTASGRPVWRKAFADWSSMGRKVQVLANRDHLHHDSGVVIVGWPSIADGHTRSQILAHTFDVVILDECHWAKSFEAKRTQAAYGFVRGDELSTKFGVASRGAHVWCLTGTPMPNSPFDLFPMLRFGAPERLARKPAVLDPEDFKRRFTKTRPMKIGHGPYARRIEVITGGQNLDELRTRIDGLMLQRKQTDVGIRPPIFEVLPVEVSAADKRAADDASRKILEAIEQGKGSRVVDRTYRDEDGVEHDVQMHLGPLRRLTGRIKAAAVAELVREEMDCGTDKVVLAYWHREVAEALAEALAKLGVTGIDGSTSAAAREANVKAFTKPDGPRVFLAQIQAAGEAIDLSAAAELIFVEMSFVPKDGAQMAMRITNHTQTRQPRVRVAAIDGSIDEAIQSTLLRKVQTIREVMK